MATVKKFAVVSADGLVENVIIANDDFSLPNKLLIDLKDRFCGPGFRYDFEQMTFVATEEAMLGGVGGTNVDVQ